MDLVRAGRNLRAIRQHKGWTIRRAADAASMSASTACRIEAGLVDSADLLTRYARGLGASVDVYVRYQGGDLDRIVNRRHGAMHEQMAGLFVSLPSWAAVPEASFSVFGERGVVDWVAWHAETRTLLIVELKSQIVDAGGLVGTMNRRARLAPEIAAPYGWVPLQVATWVVVEEGRTNRRHVARHAGLLRNAFPDDGRAMRAWLRRPDRPIRCLSFLPTSLPEKRGRGRRDPRPSIPPATSPDAAETERMAGFYRADLAR